MNAKEQSDLFEKDHDRRSEILFKKAHDYADSEDVLSAFKLTAAVAKTTVEGFAMDMIALKTVRLGNLISGGKVPLNESVMDSIEDLENYAFLLKCIILENRPEPHPSI